jgi:hypothetical protein
MSLSARMTGASGGEADRLHQIQLSACCWMSCGQVGQARSGMLRCEPSKQAFASQPPAMSSGGNEQTCSRLSGP